MNLHKIIRSKLSPMITQPCSTTAPRLFLQVGLFLLLAIFTSCSATHKIKQTHSQAESKVDKSSTSASISTFIVTTEKADTMVATKADTAKVHLYIPSFSQDSLYDVEDTATFVQEVESSTQKIIISAKPIFIHGKRKGTSITATAIKKQEEIAVKIDKTIASNSQAQTLIKNDISEKKELKDANKDVAKKRFNLMGMIGSLFILIAIVLVVYYLKNKK